MQVAGDDLDQLFPERMKSKQGSQYTRTKITRQQSSVVTDDSGPDSTVTSPDDHSSIQSVNSANDLRKANADSSKLVQDAGTLFLLPICNFIVIQIKADESVSCWHDEISGMFSWLVFIQGVTKETVHLVRAKKKNST